MENLQMECLGLTASTSIRFLVVHKIKNLNFYGMVTAQYRPIISLRVFQKINLLSWLGNVNEFSYEFPRDFYIWPDQNGFYGEFGGAFVPEILRNNIQDLREHFDDLKTDTAYWTEYVSELQSFSGRPTPVTHARRLSEHLGGAQIYLKREDLNQTGAHKINNVIGQGLLVKRLGKKRVIAETGAGQHGMATATMAARYGLKATIYMGEEDVERQRPNVFWMEQMGAEVCPVTDGTKTLKDAINQAMRDWSENYEDTHYVLGTACGPHPFPAMVAYFQSVIGFEARQQIQRICGRLPDKVYACVGGGSNALGIFRRIGCRIDCLHHL